jgi:DNA-binding NarL/FixJ family response regulator
MMYTTDMTEEVTLTEKQKQVLRLTDGRTIDEIASALGWSPRTVRYYNDVLMHKFNVRARRHLIPIGKELE